jgi:hypothetical protein
MIKAECVAASKCQTKIATFKVVMPRYILAEFNTHRAFTRNSASSRAIPLNKMIKSVEENPFTPIAWQKDHKGMQGTEYLDDLPASQLSGLLHDGYKGKEILNGVWAGVGVERPNGSALYHAIDCARELNQFSATKQICNRLLEPFMYHTVLVTATEWDNFFELRCPKYQHQDGKIFKSWKQLVKDAFDSGASRDWVDGLENMTTLERLKCNKGQADIHMMAVAEAIYDAWNEADFKELAPGEWHLPYGDQIDDFELKNIIFNDSTLEHGDFININTLPEKIKISVARCARLSYQTLGDEPKMDYIADLKLYNNLKQSGHWSPFEHVAKAMSPYDWKQCVKTVINQENNFEVQHGWLANFRGWIQQRAELENLVK